MRQHLADLRIDVRAVESEHLFLQKLAFAYLKSIDQTLDVGNDKRRTQLAFCATFLRRAGAHAILLDDHKSSKIAFSQAGKVYMELGMAYGLMMLVLGGERPELASEAIASLLGGSISHRLGDQVWFSRQGPYLLLYLCSELRSGRQKPKDTAGLIEKLRLELQASRSTQIGVLGLPVGLYITLAAALKIRRLSDIEEALLPFLAAYNTCVTQGSLDTYHWNRLAIPFHPAEPDIISVLVLARNCLRSRKLPLLRLAKKLRLSWQSQTILVDALDQNLDERR